MPEPLRLNAAGLDLTGREQDSATVAASPAAASETTICTVTADADASIQHGALIIGFAAFTIGTSGTSYNLRIRETNTSGTIIKSTGTIAASAADLVSATIVGVDTAAVDTGQVYVLTLTVANGAAESTVSAAELVTLLI
jgi:hypothetical protein